VAGGDARRKTRQGRREELSPSVFIDTKVGDTGLGVSQSVGVHLACPSAQAIGQLGWEKEVKLAERVAGQGGSRASLEGLKGAVEGTGDSLEALGDVEPREGGGRSEPINPHQGKHRC
jgi:hypothetical protein